MSQLLLGSSSVELKERIQLPPRGPRRIRLLAVLLICMALIPAAFAIFGVWMRNGGEEWLRGWGSFLPSKETAGGEKGDTTQIPDTTLQEIITPDMPNTLPLPSGAYPILEADLSHAHLGSDYIHNETFLSPKISNLLQTDVSSQIGTDPLVLVLHTHSCESYTVGQNRYFDENPGDLTYSENVEKNVIGVGKMFCDTLNQNGIGAIHCTVMHDAEGYGNAYAASLESIRFYLAHYPSIRYVIDLHRDAVTDAEGNYIRPITTIDGQEVAQVMTVVGSSVGGEDCPNWEGNLALALQLREKLNADGTMLCRPVSLKSHTYNQEVAPYSVLLEIGTGANTPEEAKLAAVYVAGALVELIKGQ